MQRKFARGLLGAATGVTLALLSAGAWSADDLTARTDAISTEIEKFEAQGDLKAARDVAEQAAKAFGAEGEKYLEAVYIVSAMDKDARLNDLARVNELYGARVEELITSLGDSNPRRVIHMLWIVANAKAVVGEREATVNYGGMYVDLITKSDGAGSQPALMAPLDLAVLQIKTGDIDAGYQRALPALDALAASSLYNLTMARFEEVGNALFRASRADLADAVFQKGVASPAGQQFTAENSRFYASYGRFMVSSDEMAAKLRSYELFEGAINISRHVGDEANTFALLNEYAVTLNNTGSSGKALTQMEDIIASAKELYGDSDDRTLDAYANYSEILRNFGGPANAVDADMDVYTKRLARYGKKDEKVLAAANGLGQDYFALNKFDEARKYFEISKELAQNFETRENIEANSDSWLLLTDVSAGKHPHDDAAQTRLVAIAGSESYAPILRIRAGILASKKMSGKDGAAAIQLLEAVRKVSIRHFTADHPLSFELERLMVSKMTVTDPAKAAIYYGELSDAMFVWLDVQSRLTNDIAVVELLRGHADDVLSDFAEMAMTDDAARAKFAIAATRWKTMVGGSGSTIYRRAEADLAADDSESRSIIRNALRLDAQVMAVMSSFRNDGETGDLVRRRGEADAALQQRLQAIGITVQTDEGTFDLRRDLKPGEAIVNYFTTRRWGPDRIAKDAITEQKIYAVLLRSGEEPTLVELGDPQNIARIGSETEIASLRGTRGAVPLLDVKKPFVELYDQLMKPLETALADVKTAYVVPDGDLFSVPFSMLRDEKGELIEDRLTVRMLTTPDAIIGANVRPGLEPNSPTVLVGDVDYRKGEEKGAEPLPGTGREIAAIGKLAKTRGDKVETLTGASATEADLRQKISTAKVVHLATHAAFGTQTNQGAASADTLWQSEIVLANSGDQQLRQRDDTDGRLYAFEIMDWDLSKLDLLVLSACETGRGDKSFLTGVRGLPTALGVAGARRSLLTLWPVEDAGTAAFMIRYYEHLDSGASFAEALRTTRREAREGKIEAAADPRVWAAFVLFEG